MYMLINIVFSYDFDILDVHDSVGENLRKYRLSFDNWIYDKNNNHDFWIIKNHKKYAVAMCSEAFVYYINNIVFSDTKATIIKKNVELDNLDSSCPTLYF